jgi:hypothetical protein
MRHFRTLRLSYILPALGLFLLAAVLSTTQSRADTETPDRKPFTIIALPDTQFYSQSYPNLFDQQTQWVARNKTNLNIVFVTQLGDIVNLVDEEYQWQAASKAMEYLDGVVPYGLAPGNHDVQAGGDGSMYEKYFPMSRLSKQPTWGSSYNHDRPQAPTKSDKNSYQLFGAGGTKFIAFNLEYCPTDPILAWTNDILKAHKNRTAIISTHYFITAEGKRSAPGSCPPYNSEGDNSGEDMWDFLITKHKNYNIAFFLNGHDIWTTEGARRRTDVVEGHTIHQLMSDYQIYQNGGEGYLRIMSFMPDKKLIKIFTYSPALDKYQTDPENEFTLDWQRP